MAVSAAWALVLLDLLMTYRGSRSNEKLRLGAALCGFGPRRRI